MHNGTYDVGVNSDLPVPDGVHGTRALNIGPARAADGGNMWRSWSLRLSGRVYLPGCFWNGAWADVG